MDATTGHVSAMKDSLDIPELEFDTLTVVGVKSLTHFQ